MMHFTNIQYQEPVEVDKTFNTTAATKSNNTSNELQDPDHYLQNAANEQPASDFDTHDSNSSLHKTNMFDESRTNESNTSLNEREINAQKSQTVTMNNQLFQEDLISNLLNYFYLPINIMYLRIFFYAFYDNILFLQ